MINRAILVGRLTKNPELRHTSNDIAVTTFTLAVNRPFKNQQGENDVDFIQCVVWRRQAENVAQYVSKGSLVGVDGRIQSRSYDDQDGNRRFITEIVADSVQFLEPKGSNPTSREAPPKREAPQKEKEEDLDSIDIAEDDLPF